MKKLLLAVLSVMLFFSCLSFVSCDSPSADNSMLKFNLSADGKSYIVSGIYSTTVDKITIPSTYNFRPVTAIDEYAFCDYDNLTSITIPNSITTIGYAAFSQCPNLMYNEYDNGLYLGNENNKYLVLVKAKDKSITSCTVHADTKIIHYDAFENCSKLKTVTMDTNSKLEIIGHFAFYGCTSLENITIPKNITTIGNYAFYNCSSLSFNEYKNGLYLGSENNKYLVLVKAKNTAIKNCAIHEDTKIIYSNAFQYCYHLTSVYIDKNSKLEIIGLNAFDNCSQLTSIILPNSVTTIGYAAFNECSSLATVTISKNSKLSTIDNRAFQKCTSLTTISIPSNIKTVADDAFLDCDNLVFNEYDNALYLGNKANKYIVLVKAKSPSIISCTIHKNTKFISYKAFAECTSLNKINIPASVVSIGNAAFAECTFLETVTFDKNSKIKTIGNAAFSGCKNITSIVIPESIILIDSFCFSNCSKLETVTISKSSRINDIGWETFNNCTSLTSITIPDTVTEIQPRAFSGCTSLETVNIGKESQLGIIHDQAFKECTSLTNIHLPNSLTKISNNAFYNCKNLQSVTIDENSKLKSIGYNAFFNCYNLTNISIPESITTISDSAFFGCDNLEFNEYNNALYFGNKTNKYLLLFKAKDKSITSCTIHPDTEIILAQAFQGCNYLTTMTLGENSNLKIIGSHAFHNCENLTSVIIGNGITTVEYGAFEGCNNLNVVYYTGTPKEWDQSAGDNSSLYNIPRYYYSETEPNLNTDGTAYDGNYWRYVDGVPVIWTK